MLISGVYRIRNTQNGHRYIGSSSNVDHRWYQHKSALINGKHSNRHLQGAWNKYGSDAFAFEIIVRCPTMFLIEQEQVLLDSGIGYYNLARDAAAPWRGLTRSRETKLKISLAQIGRVRKPESIAKHRAKVIGQKRTPEQCARMKAAAAGRPPRAYCWLRCIEVSSIPVEQIDQTGKSYVFPSMGAAVRAGYHATNVRRASITGKLYRKHYWNIRQPSVEVSPALLKNRENGTATLLRANEARRKPIEAAYPDGTIVRYEGVNDVVRKILCGNRHVKRAILDGRVYRGALWRYAE